MKWLNVKNEQKKNNKTNAGVQSSLTYAKHIKLRDEVFFAHYGGCCQNDSFDMICMR